MLGCIEKGIFFNVFPLAAERMGELGWAADNNRPQGAVLGKEEK